MKTTKSAVSINTYKPSPEKEEIIKFVYHELDDMIAARNRTYPELNDLTLKNWIDDGDKRLNAYVVSKDAQDKEDWQANVALPTIADKTTKIISGYALNVPDSIVVAQGADYKIDFDRAFVAKELIKHSYTIDSNPIIENFWSCWNCAAKGTVIEYEGYLKTKQKVPFIKSYDLANGRVEFEEREVNVDDRCISINVPLLEMYIKDFRINEIQAQPELAWVKYYSKEDFYCEFGEYADAKYVKDRGSVQKLVGENQTYYSQSSWERRVNETSIEVIRFYCKRGGENNKYSYRYFIVANGVLILDAPFLWTFNGVPVYPFAKTIFKPFVDKEFFYGNSAPNVLKSLYDLSNTQFNSIMDKEFRSINPALLIGRANQDLFDLEDEILTGSTKIYVDDITQVKEMPISPPNSSDVAMLELISGRIAEQFPTIPDIMKDKEPTAREAVLADEQLKELRTITSEFIADLWRQKNQLRLANIQLNYPQPRMIINSKGKEEKVYKTYYINNASYKIKNDDTGNLDEEVGILAIQFIELSPKKVKKLQEEANVEREMIMKKSGQGFKKVFVNTTYLDNYLFTINVLSENLYKSSRVKKQAVIAEKLQILAEIFPEFLQFNIEKYFIEMCDAYDDDPEEMLKAYRDIKAKANQIKNTQGAEAMQQPQQVIKKP